MTEPRRRPRRRRRSGGSKSREAGLWRAVPQLDDPAPIAPTADPTALLRSLGDPPLGVRGALAGYYLGAIVERAAGLAQALAATAEVLATTEESTE